MDMTGEQRIAAPRAIVWAALNDAEILQQCIPGCQSLEWISPAALSAAVKIKIGPISSSFTGEVTLSNVVAGESYTIFGEGKGGIAALARGGADVVLVDAGDETVLQYTASAQVGGKLAQFGSRLISATAQKFAQRFFADFNAAVSARADSDA